MRKKRIIISIAIAVVLLFLAWFFFFRNTSKAIAWKTAMAEKGNITTVVTATGALNADTMVQVGTQVSGIISKIFVDFNSVVHKGQVIAMIDTIFLSATRRDAMATVSKARAQLAFTKNVYERMTTLYNGHVAAKADYDQALANYQSAQADLQSALANLNHAEINIGYATIRAPIDGTVVSRNVDVGQTVAASFTTPTLFTIAYHLTKMQVEADISEADIGQVREKQEVDFTVDAYPDNIFKGTVRQIRLQPVTIQNVVNYVVIVDVANPDLKLMPGMTANLKVRVQEHDSVIKVPVTAVRFTPTAEYMKSIQLSDSLISDIQKRKVPNNENPAPNEKTYVWLKKQGKVYPVMVTIGLTDGTAVEISGNIKAGDEIATGVNAAAENTATTNNPFMPKMPSRKRS